MTAHFEDNPPNVPPRYIAPVIEQVMQLCMAQRQARARHAIRTIGSCKCGKPVYRDGLCTMCAWDKFEASNRAQALDRQRD